MNEGRKSQIVLLDERRLDFLIQPKLFAGDLLDLVASHFKLKEKRYFGLAVVDESLHYHWLQGDKRVLDHDFIRKTGPLILHFAIRFYVDTIGLLRDIQTVELFYFNARQAVFKGHIECDSETVFELAAHVLQASKGDFCSNEEAKEDIKKMPIIPTRTLKQHPSISYCEDKVIGYYKKLAGTSRGLAIVNYMTIVEKLPTYGIHYYEVKDKKEIPWWLGISPKGIAVYDKNDKTTPRRVFTWKNLENLYYRDKKFSIEVHDPKRIVHTLSSFNLYEDAIREPLEHFDDLSDAITDPTTQVSVSRRTFGASNVNVHTWLAASPQLTKSIWSMAVAQHEFYLDRKQSKGMLMNARSMSEIAADLCRSSTSLVGSDISRNSSSQSLPSLSGSRFELNTETIEAQKAEREMFLALKARKEALEEAMKKKMEELKVLCFQEGELTGQLPKETPLDPGERVPTFRRRVGTSFAITPKIVDKEDWTDSSLDTLELEYELQCKITAAAQKLAQDKSTSKYVRKQRRNSYNKAAAKLKDMEKKLIAAREQSVRHHHDPRRITDELSSGDARHNQQWDSPASGQSDRSAALPPAYHHHQHHHHHYQQQPIMSVLASPTHQNVPLNPSHSSPQLSLHGGGYQPNSVYETRTQYRSQMYPTLSSSSSRTTLSPSSSLSPASMRSLQEDIGQSQGGGGGGCGGGSGNSSVGSSSNNLYNVTLSQTSHYKSSDMLQSQPTTSSDQLHLPSKHGSLDRAYKRGDNSYGSLDRKQRRQRERQYGYSVEPRSGGGGEREGSRERGGRGGDGAPPLHLDIQSTYVSFDEQDYPAPTSTQYKVEVPVYHERSAAHSDQGGWGDATSSLRSPTSSSYPTHTYARGYDSYSPRLTETAHTPRFAWGEEEGSWGRGVKVQQIPVHHQQQQQKTLHQQYSQQAPPQSPPAQGPPYSYSNAVPVPVLHLDSQSMPRDGGHTSQPLSPTSASTAPGAQSTLVTVTLLQPHMEVSKPYETSDFFRYSERLRKQRIIDNYQRQLIGGLLNRSAPSPTPSSQSSADSDSHHSYHSSHSGSSLSHPLRLAAASAAYYAATGGGSPARSLPDSTRGGVSGLPPVHPSHYHRQDSEHSVRSDPSEGYGSGRSGGEGGGMSPYVVSSCSEFQTVRSQGVTTQVVQSQYRASFMQAVASAKHSHYQPPTPMTCQPVTSNKGNQQGK